MRGVSLLIPLAAALALACASGERATPPDEPGPAETARVIEEDVERAPVPTSEDAGSAGEWLRDPTIVAELQFASGSVELSPAARRELDALADRLERMEGEYRIELEGHADGVGDEVENRLLAAHRADAVRHYLGERHAIPLERIGLSSKGESTPVRDEASADGQARNRRVVVLLGTPPA